MKVFISWSGPKSRAIAKILNGWLPDVIQSLKPYFSDAGIEKGSRWSVELASNLEDSGVGLLILTPENIGSEWVLFEAGALSKHATDGRLCPILFGLQQSDIPQPLTQFQHAQYSDTEMLNVLSMLNNRLSTPVGPEILRRAFDRSWADTRRSIDAVIANASAIAPIRREARDIMEEILGLVRQYPQISAELLSAVRMPYELRSDLDILQGLVYQAAARLPSELRGQLIVAIHSMRAKVGHFPQQDAKLTQPPRS